MVGFLRHSGSSVRVTLVVVQQKKKSAATPKFDGAPPHVMVWRLCETHGGPPAAYGAAYQAEAAKH